MYRNTAQTPCTVLCVVVPCSLKPMSKWHSLLGAAVQKEISAPSAPLTYAQRLKLGAPSPAPKQTSGTSVIAPPASAPAPAAAAPKPVAAKAEPTVEVVMDAPETSTATANGSVA